MLSENCLTSFTSLGGGDGDYPDYNDYTEILEFKTSSGEWILIGQMMVARTIHAVSIISTEEIDIYC